MAAIGALIQIVTLDIFVNTLISAVLMTVFWYRETTNFVDFAEQQKITDAERGAKSAIGELTLWRKREKWLFIFFLASPSIVVLEYLAWSQSLAKVSFYSAIWIGFYVLQVAIHYCASVDIPPYARSRAWELFKELFTVRELIPIRVRPPS